MLKRVHLSSSVSRNHNRLLLSFCCTSPSLPVLQNCLFQSTTTSSQQEQQQYRHQKQQRQKFAHLGGKYKRLNDVSLRYSKSQQQQQSMMNEDGGEQDDNNNNNAPPLPLSPPTYQDELEHLRKLANQEIQETQNRQHSASGLAAKQHQQQQRNTNNNNNNNNNDNDENNTNASSAQDVIINREISESIGFFASSGVLLLPNTTGRFKHDERKLAAKHSSIKRMKSAYYKFDNRNNNNKFSGSGGANSSNRIMIFGQETNALAMKCARTLFPLYQQQQQQQQGNHQEEPLLIVVEKQLERLLHLNQQIHKQLLLPLLSTNNNKKKNVNDNNDEADKKRLQLLSLLIRSVDPFFSLLHTVPDCSLRRIVVNFPPPCSSDSESHRRIVNHHFLSLAHQKLVLGGDVVVATDYRPLHRFHEEQVIVTEGKLSWKDANASSVTRGTSTHDHDQDQNEENEDGDQVNEEEEEQSYVRSSASFKHQKNNKKGNQSPSNKKKKNMSNENMIDLVSIPTIDEAPARIKFSLLQQQQELSSNVSHHQQPFYIMRKVKDMDTPDHVVLQNSSHVNERRLRYGALKK